MVRRVEAGRCPRCAGELTRAERSPGRFRHCFRCRVGWKVQESSLGPYVVSRGHER
jgi:Zn-finger nucleic acid-binding protein